MTTISPRWPPIIPEQGDAREAWAELHDVTYHLITQDLRSLTKETKESFQNSGYLRVVMDTHDSDDTDFLDDEAEDALEVQMTFGISYKIEGSKVIHTTNHNIRLKQAEVSQILKGLSEKTHKRILDLAVLRYLAEEHLHLEFSFSGMVPVWELRQEDFDRLLPYETSDVRELYESLLRDFPVEQVEPGGQSSSQS